MKYIITESKFKKFLKKNFDFDLTGRIELVTNIWDVRTEIRFCVGRDTLIKLLNQNGPMFYIDRPGKRSSFYVQKNLDTKEWFIVGTANCWYYTEFQMMDELGIGDIGITLQQIIDEYYQEEL